jgi:hypothetical protein
MQGYLIYANKIHFNPHVQLAGMKVYGGEIDVGSGNLLTDATTELRYTTSFFVGGTDSIIANPVYYTGNQSTLCESIDICNTFDYQKNSVKYIYVDGAKEEVLYDGEYANCPWPRPRCTPSEMSVEIPPIGDLTWTGNGDSTVPTSTHRIEVPINQTQTETLIPSTPENQYRYGQLKLENNATLNLHVTAGEYYFNTVNVGVGSEIIFHVTVPTGMETKDFKLYIYIYDTFYMAQGESHQTKAFRLDLPTGISPTQCIIYVNKGNATIAEYGTIDGYLIVPQGTIRLDDVNNDPPVDPTAHLVAKEVWIGSQYKFGTGTVG